MFLCDFCHEKVDKVLTTGACPECTEALEELSDMFREGYDFNDLDFLNLTGE